MVCTFFLDFELVERVSSATGGNAFSIPVNNTDNTAYEKFEKFYFKISSPTLKNASAKFSCEASSSNITFRMADTFYKEEDNFIMVGKQAKDTIEVKISGLSADGPYTKIISILGRGTNQVF